MILINFTPGDRFYRDDIDDVLCILGVNGDWLTCKWEMTNQDFVCAKQEFQYADYDWILVKDEKHLLSLRLKCK